MLHALNRRRRWHNVRKVLPNKRQGSGKHIIDGGNSEPTANTGQAPEGRGRHKKNKSDDQSGDESSTGSSKASKKFRIRSLISEEMLKRKGKQHQRRSPSPTKKQSKSMNHNENRSDSGKNEKPSTQSNGESPSTIKKRKCDICAAMLTVSYLRQKGLAMEQQQKAIAEDKTQQNKFVNDHLASLKMNQPLDGRLNQRIGHSKSFSFNLLRSTKRRDFEIEELKRKLRECKDIETAKEKFILPMNQWKDTGSPKPMLTRPESFKSPSSTSQKENTPTNHQSKSLKQKIGYVIKDSRKEKKRILMDAVFHKIPYGRRSSKDGKKVNPNKIKSSSTGSSKIDPSSAEKAAGLKKTSSSTEAMSKYRWLLNHTPATRDEKCLHGDHKPKLCVAEAHCLGASTEKKMLKRVRSLPNISPFDFMQNPEFPVKTLNLRIASAVLDDQKPADNFILAEKRNGPVAAIESVAKGSKFVEEVAVDENPKVGVNTFDHQENFQLRNESSGAIESATKETILVDKDEAVDENPGVGLSSPDHKKKMDNENESNAAKKGAAKKTKLVDKDEDVNESIVGVLDTSDHQEENHQQNESSAAIESPTNETKLVEKEEDVNESIVGGLDTSNHQEENHQQNASSAAIESPTNETKLVEKDDVVIEKGGADLNTSSHEEKVDHEKESSADTGSTSPQSSVVVDKDKSFNEILGMFKVASDQKVKLERQNESSAAVGSVAKNTTVDKDLGVDKSLENGQNTLDHQEEKKSTLTSGDEVECLIQDSPTEDCSTQFSSMQVSPTEDSYTQFYSMKDSSTQVSWTEDSLLDSSSLIGLPNSPPLSAFKDFSDENEQYLFSISDQPSTDQPSIEKRPIDEEYSFSIDDKRQNSDQLVNMSTTNAKKIVEGFVHLNLESVKDNAEFHYVKEVLERSGFLENQLLGEWYASYQPIDPSLFAEVETSFLQTKNLEELESLKDDEAAQKIINDHHLLLFDLINEALLEVYHKTFTYCPHPLTYCSKIRPMPVGCRVLEEVWDFVNMYLSLKPNLQPSLDDAVSRDLQKGDGWMNLQPDAELVGIELEEMIADDLLDELVFDDLLM
ncbi:protein of unknown function DUF4378 [Cynara cardunculus var. scolymus]|uniref:DUF4378 domain-containing protein n=1 Tax=Cynara cardunculus var. scolymus TaxID=59895 RepID=A0A103YLF8_CYNCS|nr:protein of unknown function DUF4378 [Cynara cardunculus var. scolymus]